MTQQPCHSGRREVMRTAYSCVRVEDAKLCACALHTVTRKNSLQSKSRMMSSPVWAPDASMKWRSPSGVSTWSQRRGPRGCAALCTSSHVSLSEEQRSSTASSSSSFPRLSTTTCRAATRRQRSFHPVISMRATGVSASAAVALTSILYAAEK